VDIHRIYGVFFNRFRPRRIRLMYRTMGITSDTRVMDIGGTEEFWELAASLGLPVPKLTIVNLTPPRGRANAAWCVANAERLPFADGSFDLAISNSVIEHVSHPGKFAEEVRRVARRYFIQTPNRRFPVEPHFMAPCVHWLPASVRPAALRLSPWGIITRPSKAEIASHVRSTNLLDKAEMRRMFPDSALLVERCAGLAKSLIAVRR
jgi:SAM-dependent methyltransferase